MGFEGITGHEKQKGILLTLLKRERMPHAFLFSGPEGIGKKRVVMEFAKYIFCEHGTACGICRPCLKVDRGSHPDIFSTTSEESIGIEHSRDINKEVYEYPYESARRIIIIDNAERMTNEARNALLKTLEEPPSFNTFFLITSSERDIPLTIKSRCMRLIFSPLYKEQLKSYFKNNLGLNDEKAELLSCISHGSIGIGLFWTVEDNFLLRKQIAELLFGRNKSFLKASVIFEKISKSQKDTTIYLSFMLSLYRDAYLLNECGNDSMVINRDIKGLLAMEKINTATINKSIERIEQTINLVRYNINKWLVLENLMLHLMERQ